MGRLLRGRAPSIVVFLLILLAFDMVRTWSTDLGNGFMTFEVALVAPLWIMGGVAVVIPLLLEASGLRGIRLALAMALAMFAAVGATAIVLGWAHPAPLSRQVRNASVLSNEAFLYRGWWVYSVAGLLFAAYCHTREREQGALRAARAAELARADAQREIVASRLKVLQARVEPELLFDALADVRDVYRADPAAADALLDDLVTYLRAALPQMRGGASTVAREAALAEAYLRVVPSGRNKRLMTHVTIAPDVADDDFPPMVLLPLVQAAEAADTPVVQIVAPAEQHRAPGSPCSLTLRAVTRDIPEGWRDAAFQVVRDTLAHYFGGVATLDVEQAADSAAVTITWPRDERLAPPPTVSSAEIPDSSRAS